MAKLRLAPAVALVGIAVAVSVGMRILERDAAPVPEAEVVGRPIQTPHSGYVASNACRVCHPEQYASWHASYHRTMTQVASPRALAGPLDGAETEAHGRRYRLVERDGVLRVRTEDPSRDGDGAPPREREVALTTGSHHFQFYWAHAGEGRTLGLLPLAYQIAEARWIPLDAVVLAPPGVSQTTEGGEGRWNLACNRCHATGALPRLASTDPARPLAADTRVAEFGIACEACHGPAGEHARVNRDPWHRYARHLGAEADETLSNPARMDPHRASQVCGQCHSVNNFRNVRDQAHWARAGFPYRPGDDLHETRTIVRDNRTHNPGGESRFWPDGAPLVNGREYNALLGNPCFERGEMSCLSCHEMHPEDARPLPAWADDQLAPGMRGNEACVQCHERFRDGAALAAHTHHDAASAGSRCYDCHMPNTVYGLHKATRSHRIESPDVRAALATGRLPGCNLCHLDRPLAWTARHLRDWYGTPGPELPSPHRKTSAAVVWALAGNALQRTLVAWHMGWEPARRASGGDWMVPYLAQLLVDPYAATRSVAARSLRTFEGYVDLAYDFVGPPGQRREAMQRVRRRWQRSDAGSQAAANEAILLDANGRIRRVPYAQLLARRDDRPVYVAE